MNKQSAKSQSGRDHKPEKSPVSHRRKPHMIGSGSDDDVLPPPDQLNKVSAKPKPGRLISNERPLEDFNRLVEDEGDVFRKAIQDLGAVVKENVEGSFSGSAFPLAIECLQAMRRTALTYEEVETYNEWVLRSVRRLLTEESTGMWRAWRNRSTLQDLNTEISGRVSHMDHLKHFDDARYQFLKKPVKKWPRSLWRKRELR